jgi:hypothetical protein
VPFWAVARPSAASTAARSAHDPHHEPDEDEVAVLLRGPAAVTSHPAPPSSSSNISASWLPRMPGPAASYEQCVTRGVNAAAIAFTLILVFIVATLLLARQLLLLLLLCCLCSSLSLSHKGLPLRRPPEVGALCPPTACPVSCAAPG